MQSVRLAILFVGLTACGPLEVRVVVTAGALEAGCTSVRRIVEQAPALEDGTCGEDWAVVPENGTLRSIGGRYCLRAREVTDCGRCRATTSSWEIQSSAEIPLDLASSPWADCDAEVHGFDRSCAARGLEPVAFLQFRRSLQAAGSRACALTNAGDGVVVPTCWGTEPATDRDDLRGSPEDLRTGYSVGAEGLCSATGPGVARCDGELSSDLGSLACRSPRRYGVSTSGLCALCEDQVVCAGAGGPTTYTFSGVASDIAVGPTSACAVVGSRLECQTPRGPRYAAIGSNRVVDLVVTATRVCGLFELRDGDQYEVRCSGLADLSEDPSTAGELESVRLGDRSDAGPITSVCATDDRVCAARGGSVVCSREFPAPHAGIPPLWSVACAEGFTCGMALDGSEVWCWGADDSAPIAGARGGSPAQVCRASSHDGA